MSAPCLSQIFYGIGEESFSSQKFSTKVFTYWKLPASGLQSAAQHMNQRFDGKLDE